MFYKHIRSKRKMRDNIGPEFNRQGELIMADADESELFNTSMKKIKLRPDT